MPSAHPEIEEEKEGGWKCVGFVLERKDKKVYHAGDTGVHGDIIRRLNGLGGIDIAFLPVNEQNYYRDQRGIIGNMSIREAFQMAIDIGAKTVIPTHWDMFALNQVYREEIEIVYKHMNPRFNIIFYPQYI